MSEPPIPFVDLAWQHEQIADEVCAGFRTVIASSAFINGPPVKDFESAFAEYCHAAHCIGVANGTDAIELGLRAIGIGAGDTVVLPANSFIATAEAVWRAGARPVLVDCRNDSPLVDLAAAVEAVGAHRARAVIPVDLFGERAPIDELAQALASVDCHVVEDAAQSQGATRNGKAIGTGATIAPTSFYPGKNLGAYGDAGAVLTDDTDVARRLVQLRDHGSSTRYVHERLGCNSRLDSLQAIVLRAKLRRLEEWNGLRRAAADRYHELLADLPLTLPTTDPGNLHVWHLYAVRVERRDDVLASVQSEGISTAIHYPVPLHLTPALASLGYDAGSFPNAEAAARELLSLPIYPGLQPEQQERVADALSRAIASTH